MIETWVIFHPLLGSSGCELCRTSLRDPWTLSDDVSMDIFCDDVSTFSDFCFSYIYLWGSFWGGTGTGMSHSRRWPSMSSQGSMEESFYLQASLDATPERGTGERFSFSERPPSPLPHFGKSMVSAATYEQLETHLRQKEGELASYGSRLVNTLLFCCLIIFCVNLQLMEEAH